MSFQDSQSWEMYPLNGSSGQAYLGKRDGERVFFKRNTSPFITALSAEGITPKLMWTQRTYSGDVLTAQEWKDGSLLKAHNMADPAVIGLIAHIHRSDYLITMLRKAKGKVFGPKDFLQAYHNNLPQGLVNHAFLNQVGQRLADLIDDDFYQLPFTVCHGDLHHHNFLLSEDQTLYLVDWENVHIADPLSDITQVLCQYFPPSQWQDWLNQYQLGDTPYFYKRMHWYSLVNCMLLCKQFYLENRYQKMNEIILLMQSILDHNLDTSTPSSPSFKF